MSNSLNKVILIGRVGKIETRYTATQEPVVNISLATSERWKDKSTGEQKEKTEWHDIVIFGKLAQIANDIVKKGNAIYVEGHLQKRKWQDNTGADRYTTEVVLQGFNAKLINFSGGGKTHDNSETPEVTPNKPIPEPVAEAPVDFDDEIPF